MCCVAGKHQIALKNLQNNEEIPHSVLFIHGEISEKCQRNTLSITLNSEYRDNCAVSRINGEFKSLLQLNVGLNKLTLNYCNAVFSININHKVSKNTRSVTPLYIVVRNHDGCFQAREGNSPVNACARISVGLRMAQMVFAEKLRAHGGTGRKTFHLSGDCEVFNSNLTIKEAFTMTEKLIDRMPDCQNRKFVAFIGCTRYCGTKDPAYTYESIQAATVANAALGSGGLALLGTGCLFSWPERICDVRRCLEDETKVPLDELMDNSAYRRTYGGCFATTIGVLLHEMGHIFDLAHCSEGIMGSNCDRVDQMLTLKDFHGQYGNVPKRHVPTGRGTRCTIVRHPGGMAAAFSAMSHSNGVYFTENCLTLLDTHKWFNESREPQLDAGLAFNADTREICGKYPLRLVEMRSFYKENYLLPARLLYT
uniref:Zinc metalloproteinase n=1 Tax=Lutzomyia longipalpis TaxID=7200 RepID=A0A1B0CKE3_LUTLO